MKNRFDHRYHVKVFTSSFLFKNFLSTFTLTRSIIANYMNMPWYKCNDTYKYRLLLESVFMNLLYQSLILTITDFSTLDSVTISNILYQAITVFLHTICTVLSTFNSIISQIQCYFLFCYLILDFWKTYTPLNIAF